MPWLGKGGSVLIFGIFDIVSQRHSFFFFCEIQIASAGNSRMEVSLSSDGV